MSKSVKEILTEHLKLQYVSSTTLNLNNEFPEDRFWLKQISKTETKLRQHLKEKARVDEGKLIKLLKANGVISSFVSIEELAKAIVQADIIKFEK